MATLCAKKSVFVAIRGSTSRCERTRKVEHFLEMTNDIKKRILHHVLFYIILIIYSTIYIYIYIIILMKWQKSLLLL